MRVLSVFGTRPEAIKMAPVVQQLNAAPGIDSKLCLTGQHREMLDQVVDLFGLDVDYDLNVMTRSQSLTDLSTLILQGLEPVLSELTPDWVLVHGDTTTAMATSLAAYYQQIPVGHVEAGLRTGDIYAPWPEEINRSIIGRIATAHFAPTESARHNLIAESVRVDQITVTGNTVIDALLWVRETATKSEISEQMQARFSFLDSSKRLILVTGHRRENFDGGLAAICRALARLASRGDVQVVYPVHLNPVVQSAAQSVLDGVEHVHLVPPLDYVPFVWMMDRAYLIISDSGGVQEEAPALGVPVLVTRGQTERPEAVQAGAVELVGTSEEQIWERAMRLLEDADAHRQMSVADSPYGDGYAARRIMETLSTLQSKAGQ